MSRVGLPVEQMTDDALLAGLSTGSSELALAFVRRFQGHVYAVALAIVGDRAGAEDVAQLAFERAWRRAGTFDPARGSVRSWLTAIARNLALDSIRRRRTDPVDPADLVRLLGPGRTPGTAGQMRQSEQPAQAFAHQEWRDELIGAIRALPAEQARAVVMAGVYRMTAQEVADAEGIPLGTAKTRIRTAMTRLRGQLVTGDTKGWQL